MKRVLTVLVASAALLAACGEDDESAGAPAAGGGDGGQAETATTDTTDVSTTGAGADADESAETARRRGPLVKLRDSQFGPVLFSGRDRALYLFTRDPKRRTRCYGECAEAWPPFFANARPRAGRGVKADLMGTIRRRNGRRQVTYKGQPLYFYVDDPRGQVLCNDVVEFGGTWFAVTAAGNPPA